MDIKEIRELATLMQETGLTSLEYRNGGESVKLRRQTKNTPTAVFEPNAALVELQDEIPAPGNTFTVKSPMVGVFYSSPGMDEDPYVAVGDAVNAGDMLCMIEAMKIMNEITSDRDGVITEIYVENKQVVEYGQPLFRIRSEE